MRFIFGILFYMENSHEVVLSARLFLGTNSPLLVTNMDIKTQAAQAPSTKTLEVLDACFPVFVKLLIHHLIVIFSGENAFTCLIQAQYF